MKRFVRSTCLVMLAAALVAMPAMASFLDQVGATALRSVATNVDGGGIRVAQPEASLSIDNLTWEINPPNAGRPAGLFTYASSLGVTNVFPNSLGTNSWHAEAVGDNFYGITDGLATNVASVDNSEANYFIDVYVVSNLMTLDDQVVNQSFTYGELSVTDQQAVDSAYDDYIATYGTLFVSSACNGDISTYVCAPGTAYNCISVASYLGNSSIGPTSDNGRCKPDITAPDGGGGTSFTTPQVSGAAAVLLQAALRGDGGADTNSAFDMRTIKVLLLNGAVKPPDWTNATSSPLDARYGAGMLNVLNSYEQLVAGKHGLIFSTNIPAGTTHPPVAMAGSIPVLRGWDFNTNSSSSTNDSVSHYLFNVTNGASGAFGATITLTWNRQFGQTNINDLDLFLFNAAHSNLVACSTSRVDNVEHIFVPQLSAGCYDLEVLKNGGTNTVSDAETYALAWEFIAPALQISKSSAGTTLTWPLYPAGFLVEARTNLLGGAWSTDDLPAPVITNGLNSILLNTTNPLQFFHLRKPDL